VIDADDTLVEHSCVLETHATGHLLALPDFTWVLGLTDRTRQTMRLRVAVRGLLATEVPLLHYALEAFTFRDGLHVDPLTDAEVARPQHEADRKHIFRRDLKLSQECLWRQSVFKEVTSQRSLEAFHSLLAATDLKHLRTVLLQGLDLCHLTPVDLNDCARSEDAPPIPEVRHTHLVAKHAATL
jgi:hypothetical protein